MEYQERRRIISLLSTYYSCLNCGNPFNLKGLTVTAEDADTIYTTYICSYCHNIHKSVLWRNFPDYPIDKETAKYQVSFNDNKFFSSDNIQGYPTRYSNDLGNYNFSEDPAITSDEVLAVVTWVKGLTTNQVSRLMKP